MCRQTEVHETRQPLKTVSIKIETRVFTVKQKTHSFKIKAVNMWYPRKPDERCLMADHRTASCSVLMMPEEHSNDSACSHEQQSLLCTTIVSLHLSAVPVSHSRASVLAVGPHAQIFPCPWNLFILCAVDFTSSIMLCYCCQWTTTAAHCLSSCFFLLSLLSHLLPCSNCWKPNREKQ